MFRPVRRQPTSPVNVLDPLSINAAKQQLRAIAKSIRADAFARHGRSASEEIAAHGLDFANRQAGLTVSGFFAINDEIDPQPLMLRLVDDGHHLALPTLQGPGKPLLFRRWHPGDPMAEQRWGIREPLPSAPQVQPNVILVPLLAFDGQGYRLGYGGGYYDRTLAEARATRSVTAVGLAYDAQEVQSVPHDDYDQRLDWVLTPSGPRKFSQA